MARLILSMTMSVDGFFAGPGGELDWMTQTPDPELGEDTVSFFDRFDRGFIGYPTGRGMIPYWRGVAADPAASPEARALADAVNKLHPILISSKPEPMPWQGAELLVVENDEQLIDAVRREKAKAGKDLGVPGGIRTAQTLVRLGLVDEYVLTVHPVTLGVGQRVFTGRTGLRLIEAKTYRSGVLRCTYHPAP